MLPANVQAVHDQLAGPGEPVCGEGRQTDFYDREEQVLPAVSAAAEHFKKKVSA
jgi:hypothetical protein